MASPQYNIARGSGAIDYRVKGTGVDFYFIHVIIYQYNSTPVHLVILATGSTDQHAGNPE
jgi:hypothetical protein